MKKALIVLALSVALVLSFAATAYAAIWNFEKDFGVSYGGYYMDPAGTTVRNPGGTALDSRGRPKRIYISGTYANVYQMGAAGSGNIYANTVPVVGGVFASDTASGTAGQTYYKMAADGLSAPGTLYTSGAMKYIYLSWGAVDPRDPNHLVDTANTGSSPHGDYLLSTIKCAVCHSVHTAAPGAAPAATTGSQADTLLRMKAKDACGYCHVAAGSTVMDPVYGGVYPIPAEAGHALGGPCMECHTGPHAAKAETEVASLVGKLLTLATDYGLGEGVWEGDPNDPPWSTVLSRVAAMDASATAQGFTGPVTGFTVAQYRTDLGENIKNQAVGVFCGGCHEGSYANTIAGASASNKVGFQSGLFSGHRTMASATDTWNSVEATKSTSAHRGIKIADDAAMSCYDCHDSDNGYNTGTKAFPHNWGTVPGTIIHLGGDGKFDNQTFAWLLRASNSSRSDLTTVGGPGGKLGHAGTNGGTLSDGVCLKCHRWGVESGAATMGVGLSF